MIIENTPSNNGTPFKATMDGAERFEREGFDGFKQVPIEQGLGFSALTIWAHGEHPRKHMVEGTRVYFVSEGEGTFTLGDEVHQVQDGDVFVIPAGADYSYEGAMELFEVNIASEAGSVVDEKLV